MESYSSCNVESGQKLKQNEDAEETKSHVNDNSIIYFDCKICQNTVSACKDQENVDPNSEPEICRNCKASQKVQNTDDTNNSILRAPNSKTSQPVAAAVPQEEFDAVNISPLTSNNGDNNNIIGIGSSSSIASGPPADLRSPFSVGDSHTSAVSIKPPKTASSNYGVMHLYESHGVYDTELESLIKESNQKRIDKFYAGVDVIYKPNDRKVCTCVPLLCPAKVYYSVAAEKDLQYDVIVGIMVDSHNSPVPVIAVFDAFNQFKNLSRGRHVIHTYFNRFQPTSITHDFTADEVNSLSQELFRYLNVKSAMQQMEGNTTIRPLMYNMKLKLIKCLF